MHPMPRRQSRSPGVTYQLGNLIAAFNLPIQQAVTGIRWRSPRPSSRAGAAGGGHGGGQGVPGHPVRGLPGWRRRLPPEFDCARAALAPCYDAFAAC